jgi:hypothetical protein
LYDFIAFDFLATFRSSNDETSGSLGDRDRFQVQPHDTTLEQTADSQERSHDDATLKELSKPSPSLKRMAPSRISFLLLPPVVLPSPFDM